MIKRLSICEGDPGFEAWKELREKKIKITLDGFEQFMVMTVDAEQGWLRRFICDEKGIMKMLGTQFATEVLKGKVEISFYD